MNANDGNLSRGMKLGGGCARYPFHDLSPDVAKLEMPLSISERCLETEKGKKRNKFFLYRICKLFLSARRQAPGKSVSPNPENITDITDITDY